MMIALKNKFHHCLFSVCCNRNSFICAIHALIENVIAFILSSLLIHYDNYQIKNRYLSIFTLIGDNQTEIIRNLLKGQLAAAALMLVSNVAFAGLFVWVCVKVFWLQRGSFSNGGATNIHLPPAVWTNPARVDPAMDARLPILVRAPGGLENQPSVASNNNERPSTHQIACPNCGHIVPSIS